VLPVLLHVPPPPSVSVIVWPTHTDDGPLIAVGSAFTVIGFMAAQPVGSAKVIVPTPILIPVTTPLLLPILIVALPVVQTPPVPSVSVVVAPMHTLPAPLIAGGIAFTVTVVVVMHPGPVV